MRHQFFLFLFRSKTINPWKKITFTSPLKLRTSIFLPFLQKTDTRFKDFVRFREVSPIGMSGLFRLHSRGRIKIVYLKVLLIQIQDKNSCNSNTLYCNRSSSKPFTRGYGHTSAREKVDFDARPEQYSRTSIQQGLYVMEQFRQDWWLIGRLLGMTLAWFCFRPDIWWRTDQRIAHHEHIFTGLRQRGFLQQLDVFLQVDRKRITGNWEEMSVNLFFDKN